MKRTVSMPAAVLVALACGGALDAHHTGSMYQTSPLWVQGTVVRFENIDPHTITTIEEQSADGPVRRWAVEGPAQWQIERFGLRAEVPSVGDVVMVCAFPYKSVAELSRLFPGVDFSTRRSLSNADGSSPQFVAGHVIVAGDGQMRLWEPHGLMSECIGGSEQPTRESWLAFLNSSPRARQGWCDQRGYEHVQSTPALRALVREIDGALDAPCQ